ncbi:TrkH family potassium uptake protein [Sinomonas halotolerans]|uniref:Potassium transporter TrkG n=1 Tax=Sinomonas halotolerans TaxID=1644133 RepID=A0ABU9WZ94_9MICC
MFKAHPLRLVPLGFLAVITVGTLLLMLPIARTDDSAPLLMPALFTAVSATCVTGLSTVDVPSFWTPFGHAVILALIQVGGFGIMTLASLLVLLVRKNLGLRGSLVAQSETHSLNLGDVRGVLIRVAMIMGITEAIVAVILTARFWFSYAYNPFDALWHGVFHAVSAFNNAGFALYSSSLMEFGQDPWIVVPVCIAVLLGAIGFPVLMELRRTGLHPRLWTVHTRLTLYGTLFFLAAGGLIISAFEWGRDATMGPLSVADKLLMAFAATVFPRTAGFNTLDYSAASPDTLLVTDILMFIGGGSAGTAGGIKITTFLVLAFAIWNEVRGHDHVTIGHRTISSSVQRQALSVALLGVAMVVLATLALLRLTEHSLDKVLFEAVSAFATVGLSTGITPSLADPAQLVVILLMFLGRVGTITVASALALTARPRLYALPEERPVIG